MNNFALGIKLWANKRFFGWEIGFTALEAECINQFCAVLPSHIGDIVRKQILSSDAVIRFANGRRTVLQFLATPIQNVQSFQLKDLEMHVCTILIENGQTKIFSEIVFELGVFVGIEFSRSPNEIDPKGCKFKWTRLLIDLNDNTISKRLSLDLATITRPILALINKQVELNDIFDASPALVRETFLERLSCSVPEDFVSLLSETNAFTFENGSFIGTQARTLPWPDESLVLVAEDTTSSWALCFRLGDSQSGLLLVNEVDAELHKIEGNFAAAIVWFTRWIRSPEDELPDVISLR